MNRIAELRKKKNISQIELAKHLCIAQNTLSQYENEVRNPTAHIITEIAKFFNVTTNYVLGLPEASQTVDRNISLLDITKIVELDSEKNVNLYLGLGWRLLHIATVSDIHPTGHGTSGIVYTLGWSGKPEDTIDAEPPRPGDEHEEYYR